MKTTHVIRLSVTLNSSAEIKVGIEQKGCRPIAIENKEEIENDKEGWALKPTSLPYVFVWKFREGKVDN